MGINELISLIKSRIGFRTDLDEYIMQECQLAQYMLEKDVRLTPWFLWRAADICVRDTCLDLAVPVGFLRMCEYNDPLFQCEGVSGAITLNRAFADDVFAKELAVAAPSSYTLQASNIRLNRKANGILRIFYFSTCPKLSLSVSENYWTEHAFDLLLNKTGMAVAATIQNESAMAFFAAQHRDSYNAFADECTSRDDVGYNLLRISTPYTAFNSELVGVWVAPESTEPCTCGG